MKTKKRTIKDALAEKAAAKASGKPAAPAKVPLKDDGGFVVTFACGHTDFFEPDHLEKKCSDCRLFGDPAFRAKSDALERLRIERIEQEAKEAKEKPPAAKPQPAPGKSGPKRPDIPGRLPDGAVFHLLYNASTQTWWGTLKVGDAEFSGEKGGVFKLLRILDAKYRKTIVPAAEAAK